MQTYNNPKNAFSDLSDNEILAKIKLNDKEAYRALVERYLPKLFRLACKTLKSEAEADDVVQDALFSVWLKRADWEEGKAQFSTWVYKITLNKCIDIIRKNRGGNVELNEEMHSEDAATAEETAHAQQVSSSLAQYIEMLPEQQRVALTLFYYEELNIREIATIMFSTEQATRALLMRGRQNLKSKIGGKYNNFTL